MDLSYNDLFEAEAPVAKPSSKQNVKLKPLNEILS